MPFYVYRMYVRRIPKPRASSPTIFFFEPHYALARSYAQEVVLVNINVPSIDGFQCPTVEQDPEQNALLKAILFSPWACTDPMTCGNVLNFRGLLSNGDHAENYDGGASQPAVSPVPLCRAQACTHTFRRAWNLRRSEIHVLAQIAESRCFASR